MTDQKNSQAKIEKGRTIAILGVNDKGWTREFGVNKVNGYNHYEFRSWGPEGEPGICQLQLKGQFLDNLNKALSKALEGNFEKVYPMIDNDGNRIGEKYLHWSLIKQKEKEGPYTDMRFYAKDGEEPKFQIRDFNPLREDKYKWVTLGIEEIEILHESLSVMLEAAKAKESNGEEENAVKYEIVTKGPVLHTNDKTGWTLEVNEVSWNDREPKLDIRQWSPDHDKCGKGVTLSLAQGMTLGIFAQELLDREHGKETAEEAEGPLPEEVF